MRRYLSRLGSWLLAHAERRLPALTRLKQPEALPLTLDRHRIYVVPSAFGLAFAGLLAVLGIGALNYDNNPALILAFVLASSAHTGLLIAFLGLRGLRLVDVEAAPVHAGEVLKLRFHFTATESRRRLGLCLTRGACVRYFDLEGETDKVVEIDAPTVQRGWMRVDRVSVSIRRPLGMFLAWSWLHPDRRVLVYPRPEHAAPPLPLLGQIGTPRRARGPDESVHGLREYRSGDALRTIAWKRSAQTGQLQVKEFETPRGHDVVLDWQLLGGLDPELRIRRLTRWLLDAEQRGARSTLQLPGQKFGPARGDAHLHACLAFLATFRLDGPEHAA